MKKYAKEIVFEFKIKTRRKQTPQCFRFENSDKRLLYYDAGKVGPKKTMSDLFIIWHHSG